MARYVRRRRIVRRRFPYRKVKKAVNKSLNPEPYLMKLSANPRNVKVLGTRWYTQTIQLKMVFSGTESSRSITAGMIYTQAGFKSSTNVKICYIAVYNITSQFVQLELESSNLFWQTNDSRPNATDYGSGTSLARVGFKIPPVGRRPFQYSAGGTGLVAAVSANAGDTLVMYIKLLWQQ